MQVSHILNTSCPDCSWTEVGGPGLIAFRVSARPWNSSRVPVPAAWVPSVSSLAGRVWVWMGGGVRGRGRGAVRRPRPRQKGARVRDKRLAA